VGTQASGRQGIGLRNVRERLAVHFGAQGELRTAVDQQLWTARVRMPLLREPRP
jgi:sensor histidine kinase YesM